MLNEVKHLSRASTWLLLREKCFTSFSMTAYFCYTLPYQGPT